MGSDWNNFPSTARTNRQTDTVALIYKIDLDNFINDICIILYSKMVMHVYLFNYIDTSSNLAFNWYMVVQVL
jgi:hypothetical protein